MSENLDRPTGTPQPAPPQFAPPSGRPVSPGALVSPLRQGRVTKLAAFLVAVACVLVAGLAVEYTPLLNESQIKRAQVGETVRFYQAEVTVTKVEVGTLMQAEFDDTQKIESKGLLLALTVSMEAPEQEQRLDARELHAAGDRVYESVDSAGMTVPPGYAGTSTFVYEVDPEYIDDLYVEMGDGAFFYSYPQELHIGLGITSENADQWRKAGRGKVVEGTTLPELRALT